jgi:hypothetical protein
MSLAINPAAINPLFFGYCNTVRLRDADAPTRQSSSQGEMEAGFRSRIETMVSFFHAGRKARSPHTEFLQPRLLFLSHVVQSRSNSHQCRVQCYA